MNSLPYPIFKVVQGLCYPKKSKILNLGEWDNKDWGCSQIIIDELSTDTDIAIVPSKDEDILTYFNRFKHIDYCFNLVLHSFERESLQELLKGFEQYVIIESVNCYIGVVLHKQGEKSFLGKKIVANADIDIDSPTFFLPEFTLSNWSQQGNIIYFESPETQIEFVVPIDFSLKRTSLDLLWTIEHVLLSPWHDKYQLDWVPTRRPGKTAGLSFSGGVDSTAAMCLMPEDSLLFYMERNFESMIQHENAKRFISHLKTLKREIIVTQSNHEKIRTYYGKNPGFSTDYACMVHLILLADYFDLDAAGTGMPLENSYFYHGSKIRDFGKSGFWKRYFPIFSYLGIPLYQPVAGCSEILNNAIVISSGLNDYATSCLRSRTKGVTCDSCWKCFRKNTFNNKRWIKSPEISKFLSKRPLKQGVATLFALQLINKRDGVLPDEALDLTILMDKDLSFLNNYWEPSLDLLPDKYRDITERKLSKIASKMEIDLYSLDAEFTIHLRGEGK